MMTLSKINNARNGYYAPDYMGGVLDSFFNDAVASSKKRKHVLTNVLESDEDYKVELALPGYTKEDVSINVESDQLTIKGKKEDEKLDEKVKFTKREFRFGEFEKTFTLPDNIAVDKINATFKDGILTLVLPKKEPAKPIAINIDVK